MDVQSHRLNDLAASELSALRADGVRVTDDDVIELNHLGWRVQKPGLMRELSRGKPIPCGNVWLWPLTINASDWFDSIGCRLPCAETALAYAMAHCQKEDIQTTRLCDVLLWRASVRATTKQLRYAVSEVLRQSETSEQPPSSEDDNPQAFSLGDLSATLVLTCGGTPKMWERHVSLSYARDMLTTHIAQRQAEGKQGASIEVIEATAALGWAAEKIRMRDKGENVNG